MSGVKVIPKMAAQENAIIRLLIALPAYNHAENLKPLLLEITSKALPVLVIDDGSTESLEELVNSVEGVSFIRHEKNLGKGAALQTAALFALQNGFDAFVSFDADGQHLVNSLDALICAHKLNPNALILGARNFSGMSKENIPASSIFGRSFSNFWVWVETGHRLADTQTGLRVYPLAHNTAGSDYFLDIRAKRYDFEIEVLARAAWSGIPLETVPVEVYYPPPGERISHFGPFKDNLRLSIVHSLLCTERFLRLIGSFLSTLAKRGTQPSARVGKKDSAENGLASGKEQGAGMLRFVNIFGQKACYLIMLFPVTFFFFTRHTERSAITELHRRVDSNASSLKILVRSWLNFWYFSASIVDRLSLPINSLKESCEALNGKQTSALIPPSSILVGSHFGDWIIIAYAVLHESNSPIGIVLNPGQTPEFFSRLMNSFKSFKDRFRIIDSRNEGLAFVLQVKDILEAGGHVCFLCDRVPPQKKWLSKRKFLGADADFLKAPFELAWRLGLPICFFNSIKIGPWPWSPYQFRGSVLAVPKETQHPITKNPQEAGKVEIESGADILLSSFVTCLETLVRERPEQWYNFFSVWSQPSSPSHSILSLSESRH